MSGKRKTLLGLLVVWVGASLVTLPPRHLSGPPMLPRVPISPEVRHTLEAACQDCHSDQPRLPWYAYVAPVSWRVREHIVQGRARLNLSQWDTYPAVRQLRLLSDIANAVQTAQMPTADYLLIHKDARITESEEKALLEWIQQQRSRVIASMAAER